MWDFVKKKSCQTTAFFYSDFLVAVFFAAGFFAGAFSAVAFVAGIVLSESEFSHQALTTIEPLRDIFGLLFFVSVGMLFDPTFALANGLKIALTVAAIFAGKALITGSIARAFGYVNMAPWIIGLGGDRFALIATSGPHEHLRTPSPPPAPRGFVCCAKAERLARIR